MQNPTVQTHKKYGLIIGATMVLLHVVIYLTALDVQLWTSLVLAGVFLIGLLLNAWAFSRANNGQVSLGQVFSSGFKTTAIVSLFIVVWSVSAASIFPPFQERTLEITRQRWVKSGQVSEAEIQTGLAEIRNHFTLTVTKENLFLYLKMGLIFSLIAAAVAPKNKRPLTTVV